jgi:2-oxoglutarate ferredoxin oxidoreductase subunit beta
MLKAALAHRGTVLIDVISPCVTFNDHEGSTKSYKFVKDHEEPLHDLNFVPVFEDIAVDYDEGTSINVTMHDGSSLRLRKLEEDYDPTDKIEAVRRLMHSHDAEEVLTGVLYVNTTAPNFVEMLNMTDRPLASLGESEIRPSREVLEECMEELR